MKIEFVNNDGKRYVYNESPWTGKKELTVNDRPASKLSKKQFQLPDDGVIANVKGSFISGVKLELSDGGEIVLCKNKWYEWLLIFLPVLNLGLGVLCGAIGGGLSGLFTVLAAYINASMLRSELNWLVKVIVCLVVFVVSFLAWFMLYAMIVGGLAAAFPSIFS